MIARLFMIGLALIPFTAIYGIPFLGELKTELSAHIFILAIGLSLFPVLSEQGKNENLAFTFGKTYGLPVIFFIMMSVICLSFIFNFSEIEQNSFHGRSGLEKFVSSNILIFYGFALATLTYHLAEREPWEKLIIKPLTVSVLICAAFSVIEMSGHFIGPIGGIYAALSRLIHGGVMSPEWDLRLRSVASEPPDFANTAGYIWPWLLASFQFSKGKQRFWFFSLWMLLNVMILLSAARTSLVVVSGLFVVFGALRVIYLPLYRRAISEKSIPFANVFFLLFLPILFLFLALNADDIVHYVIIGDRVSNLSRLASMTAAIHMFEERPLLGFGFGQFGFHVSNFMPSWGFLSYEIRDWLFGDGTFWPAVYSVYARFGADMGLVGIFMWIGLWLFLAHALLHATLKHREETGELPFAAYPLIMSCFCVLLAGIPNDSVRAPMIWINMGLACRYLQEMRLAARKRGESMPKETA